MGISVPGTLSVCGFDNSEWASALSNNTPSFSITTIAQNGDPHTGYAMCRTGYGKEDRFLVIKTGESWNHNDGEMLSQRGMRDPDLPVSHFLSLTSQMTDKRAKLIQAIRRPIQNPISTALVFLS